MKKKLTKVQKIINFVYNNGPCTWTDIQMFITNWKGTAKELYESSERGYGCSGIWQCVTSPARGRHYFLDTKHCGPPSGGTKKYVVVDSRTSLIKLKNNSYE
jgi:hypothetical protein